MSKDDRQLALESSQSGVEREAVGGKDQSQQAEWHSESNVASPRGGRKVQPDWR